MYLYLHSPPSCVPLSFLQEHNANPTPCQGADSKLRPGWSIPLDGGACGRAKGQLYFGQNALGYYFLASAPPGCPSPTVYEEEVVYKLYQALTSNPDCCGGVPVTKASVCGPDGQFATKDMKLVCDCSGTGTGPACLGVSKTVPVHGVTASALLKALQSSFRALPVMNGVDSMPVDPATGLRVFINDREGSTGTHTYIAVRVDTSKLDTTKTLTLHAETPEILERAETGLTMALCSLTGGHWTGSTCHHTVPPPPPKPTCPATFEAWNDWTPPCMSSANCSGMVEACSLSPSTNVSSYCKTWKTPATCHFKTLSAPVTHSLPYVHVDDHHYRRTRHNHGGTRHSHHMPHTQLSHDHVHHMH